MKYLLLTSLASVFFASCSGSNYTTTAIDAPGDVARAMEAIHRSNELADEHNSQAALKSGLEILSRGTYQDGLYVHYQGKKYAVVCVLDTVEFTYRQCSDSQWPRKRKALTASLEGNIAGRPGFHYSIDDARKRVVQSNYGVQYAAITNGAEWELHANPMRFARNDPELVEILRKVAENCLSNSGVQ